MTPTRKAERPRPSAAPQPQATGEALAAATGGAPQEGAAVAGGGGAVIHGQPLFFWAAISQRRGRCRSGWSRSS